MRTIAREDLTPGGQIHTFEAAGLGKSPYTFLGVREMKFKATPEAPTQPGGACDYCGTAIINAFFFRAADGKQFKVGCDCMLKTGDKGLRKIIAVEEKKKRMEKARIKREKDAEKFRAVKLELEEKIKDPILREKLAGKPHPVITTMTLLNYVEFLIERGGLAGKMNAKKIMEGA